MQGVVRHGRNVNLPLMLYCRALALLAYRPLITPTLWFLFFVAVHGCRGGLYRCCMLRSILAKLFLSSLKCCLGVSLTPPCSSCLACPGCLCRDTQESGVTTVVQSVPSNQRKYATVSIGHRSFLGASRPLLALLYWF